MEFSFVLIGCHVEEGSQLESSSSCDTSESETSFLSISDITSAAIVSWDHAYACFVSSC